MKVGRKIRAPKVRLIGEDGSQIGIVPLQQALSMADESGLDLVEVVSTATPPVCKILDFGRFRYQQTKKEKEQRKTQHQSKVKEIKFKPSIAANDMSVKMKHAREFLLQGDKVRLVCMFRGRQVQHAHFGQDLMQKFFEDLGEISLVEVPPKMMGRTLSATLSPRSMKKAKEKNHGESKNEQIDSIQVPDDRQGKT